MPASDTGGSTDADASASSAPTLTTDWAGAAQKIRDTSSTLLKTFAGLATLLLGSGPLLANLSSLHADSREALALTGGALALAGLGVIIWQAANVSLTRTTDMSDLLARNPDAAVAALLTRIEAPTVCDFYLNGTTLQGLTRQRARAVGILGRQQLALAKDPGTNAATATFISAQIAQSQANINNIDGLLRNVEDWANYEKIADTFRQARHKMFAAGAVAVVGVGLWLGLVSSGSTTSSSSTTTSSSATSTPVTASTSLGTGTLATLTWKSGKTSAEKTRIAKYRGSLKKGKLSMKACSRIGVLVLGGTGTSSDPWQLSTLPANKCPVQLRFPATSELATLSNANPVGQINASVRFDHDAHLKATDFVLWLIFGVIGAALVILTRRFLSKD